MQALLNTAVEAAHKAGDRTMRYIRRLDELEVKSKSRNEFVTKVDMEAEETIIGITRTCD